MLVLLLGGYGWRRTRRGSRTRSTEVNMLACLLRASQGGVRDKVARDSPPSPSISTYNLDSSPVSALKLKSFSRLSRSSIRLLVMIIMFDPEVTL